MAERFYSADSLGPGEYELTGAGPITSQRFDDTPPAIRSSSSTATATSTRRGSRPSARRSWRSPSSPFPSSIRLPFPLVIASALPKGDRADFLIEKLVELGVTRFEPLITARRS